MQRLFVMYRLIQPGAIHKVTRRDRYTFGIAGIALAIIVTFIFAKHIHYVF